MTTEQHSSDALDAGAPPVSAPVVPAPAPGRDVAAVQADLLKIADDLENNTDWTRREGLMEKRGRLRQELDSLTPKKPLYKDDAPKPGEKPTKEDKQDEFPDPSIGDFGKVEIAVPETLSETHRQEAAGFAADIGQLAVTAGVSQEVVQRLFNHAVDLAAMEEPGAWDSLNPDATTGSLKIQLGDDAAKAVIRDAQAAVRALGPSTAKYLDATGLGNSPAVLQALAAYHRGEFSRSKESAAAELKKVRANPKFWSGDKTLVNRARLLSAIAAEGQSSEMAMPARKGAAPAPTSRDRIEGQIKALRANPAYLDRDSPSHKEVVALVAELYRKLDG